MTLEEVNQLDAGYQFQDEKWDYAYRGKEVEIPTIKEIFKEFGDMKHMIELKDSNRPQIYEKLMTQMWSHIEEYKMKHNILMTNFDDTINQRFSEISSNEVPVRAGKVGR